MAKLLIFDVDGVLEKEEEITNARKEAQIKAVAHKLGITIEEARKEYSDAAKRLPPEKRNTSVYILMALGFSRKQYFKIIDDVDPEGMIEPYEHCEDTLDYLSKDNVIVTLSNTPRKSSIRTLEILGISNYVKKAYCADDFMESKPSMEIIRKIMAKEGFKARDTVCIGNSPEKDLMPAKKLGARTILFDPKGEHKKSEWVDDVVRTLIKINKLI